MMMKYPRDPASTYEGFGWVDADSFFGTITWREFDAARQHVHLERLRNRGEWMAYCRSGRKPDDIPDDPKSAYPSKFVDYYDWLNVRRVAEPFYDFRKARAIVRKLRLQSEDEWHAYCRTQRLHGVPFNPHVYAEYISIADWLGIPERG